MALRPIATAGAIVVSAGLVIAAGPVIAPSLTARDYSVVANSDSSLAADSFNLEKAFAGLDEEALRSLVEAFFGGYPDLGASPAGFVKVSRLFDQIASSSPMVGPLYEEGAAGLSRGLATKLAAAVPDPTGQLDLVTQVQAFFDAGATDLVGNLLLDNLKQGSFEYGLVDAFFFGYAPAGQDPTADGRTGIFAAAHYLVDRLTGPGETFMTTVVEKQSQEVAGGNDTGPARKIETTEVKTTDETADNGAEELAPAPEGRTADTVDPVESTPAPGNDGKRSSNNHFNIFRGGMNATPGVGGTKPSAGRKPATGSALSGALQGVANAIQGVVTPKPLVKPGPAASAATAPAADPGPARTAASGEAK